MMAATNKEHVVILTPVLDDWESFKALTAEIDNSFVGSDAHLEIIAVDDGSVVRFVPQAHTLMGRNIHSLEVIHLAANLGHQRAIAVGLSLIAQRTDVDTVVIMDSDGEDRPADIGMLLANGRLYPNHIVLAQRARRSEGPAFRSGYYAYKFLFRLLTGRVMDFGNFCLLPINAVRSLVHTPDLWNNLAATVAHSRLPSIEVRTTRGTRLAGQSHMSLTGLVVHGLSAMSVYSDVIFVRLLIACGMVGLMILLSGLLVVLIRLFTNFGVPGWASAMVGDLLIIFMQAIVVAIATILMVLHSRSQRPIVPFIDAPEFVESRHRLQFAQSKSARDTFPRALPNLHRFTENPSELDAFQDPQGALTERRLNTWLDHEV
jgi:polyisoprenyl-phosphate glycosyltransferase